MYGSAPKIHLRSPGGFDDTDSMCGYCVHGTPTTDAVDCKRCLRIIADRGDSYKRFR